VVLVVKRNNNEKSNQNLDSEKLSTDRDDDFDVGGIVSVGYFVRPNRKRIRR